MSADHYRTLAGPAEFRRKIERSEFLGIAFHVESDEGFYAGLHRLEKRHFDATHHCWAFRLFGAGETRARSSDAGEPSGTAGKPILSALESAAVHDVAVVVVRWYGGVKLGTGGLSRAYRDTAAETLGAGRFADRFLYDRIVVTAPFEQLSVIYRLIEPPAVLLVGESFGESNQFSFDVRRSRVAAFEHQLLEHRLTFSRGATPP